MTAEQTDWRRNIRWFLAEFLVVVTGILVALLLQAWYQRDQNARAERAYMTQLKGDLEATRSQLDRAIREDSVTASRNRYFVDALYTTTPLPPDSVFEWLTSRIGYYSEPRPVIGTVTTLIATGDIRLIRDGRLRSAIVAYAGSTATDIDEINRNIMRLVGANDAERIQRERINVPPVHAYTADQLATLVPRYVALWPAIRSSPDLRGAYQVRMIAFSNRLFYLNRLRDSTAELLALVENE